jgi:hypothetical protein
VVTGVLAADLAARYATIALGHVAREYPNKLDHVLAGDADARTPRDLHPIFFGSFDWHSCVHGYWMLARLLRLFPDMAPARDIQILFEHALTPEKAAGELAYLDRSTSGGFERPYGWAWFLALATELRLTPDSARWGEALKPLEKAFVARFRTYLPKLTYPVRAGTHANTAFALILASHYADAVGDADFKTLCAGRASIWFGDDTDAHPFEPSGDDFLSPTLVEAACMRRLMPDAEFRDWFRAFLPRLGVHEPQMLFRPASVSDRSDGKIAHLDGLNLSRAWCMRALAPSLDAPIATILSAAADAHMTEALKQVAGDYMGEHWLASFAVLALAGL